MHPAAPFGCERICKRLGFAAADFFSWENAFLTPAQLAEALGERPSEHELVPLPPRFDFFERHESQGR